MTTPDNQKALVLLDRESRVTPSKRDFNAMTKALNDPLTPNAALNGALAKAVAGVKTACR